MMGEAGQDDATQGTPMYTDTVLLASSSLNVSTSEMKAAVYVRDPTTRRTMQENTRLRQR